MPVLTDHIGELAALGAAMCWVFTSLAFAAASRRIGPTAVNLIRLFIAFAALMAINRILFGAFVPPIARTSLVLLGVSGVIGLTVGDQLFFTALVDIGPRMSTLLMTCAPPVAALLAWPLLEETLGGVEILGIAITLSGIAWVVLERPTGVLEHRRPARHRVRGVVLGAGAGTCQAIGLVLSKLGMGRGPETDLALVDPWTATMYRMAFACLGILVLAPVLRAAAKRAAAAGAQVTPRIEVSPEEEHLPPADPPLRERSLRFAMLMVLIGVTFGPVIGVWSSMVAVDRADAGIAATLMAMTPVFILPFAVWIERERLTWRAAAGAAIAVSGVAILATT